MRYEVLTPEIVVTPKKKNWISSKIIVQVILTLAALIFILPVWLVLVNSFKPLGEILSNTASLPKNLYLDNFRYVINQMNFFRLFLNTFVITAITIPITVLLSAMCAYMLSRTNHFISAFILALLISSMTIPFQTIMIPLAKVAHFFNLINSIPGLILIYLPLYAPFAVFMFHGFIKTIPREMEESAMIDGCSVFGTFYKIIFPILLPVTSSIIIIFTLWLWNDFPLPLIMLQSGDKKTITIGIYSFFSAISMRWDYALTALSLSAMPILLFFIFMQKYIIKGAIAGAVKG